MSEIKVNKISPRTNCGTVTLGDSGDTFTIPAGATITNNGTAAGFGATGAVSWDTTVKTSGFTAVSGVGYFVNTTGGAVTVNLPAGTAGAVVGIKDYANTFDTNAVTVAPNGSDKIGGDGTTDATLSTEGIAVTFVFIDSTRGWLVTDSGLQSEMPTAQFISGTGGTITTCGNFKIHTFTGPGTFEVTCAGNAGGSNSVSYTVIAGGGGGGRGPNSANTGAGGGAGGYREGLGVNDSFTGSPLRNPTGVPVSVQSYPITVGGGGSGGPSPNPNGAGADGSNSIFSTITSTGGGGGGGAGLTNARAGGSGGGAAGGIPCGGTVGAGNTPPVSPPQGSPGGQGAGTAPAGGGGGATDPGSAGAPGTAGAGGDGATNNIDGSSTDRAGGGSGSNGTGTGNSSNPFGGGGTGSGVPGCAGVTNKGGGGGGAYTPYNGGNGGSGIVIIRYKFQ